MSSEWAKLKIQDIGEVKSGKRLPLGHSLVDVATPYPYIRLVDVSHGSVQRSDLQFLTAETRAVIKRYIVNTADVCLAIVGHTIGMVFYIDAEWNDVNLTENAARITNVHCSVNSRYLYYYLVSPIGQTEIISRKVGSAQGKLPLYNIKSLEVTVPPRKAQDEIVDILDAMSSRITLLRETNATLEAIAQALFKSWFVDFDPVRAKLEGRAPEGMDEATARLFPDSFEESALGLVPKGWRVGNVGAIANVIDCLHSKKPELIDAGKPFLQLNNIRNDGLLDTSEVAGISDEEYGKWISRIEAAAGDCVITNVGRVGAVAQIPSGFKAAMGRNMTAIRLQRSWPYPTYLIELLQSKWMRSEIENKTDTGTILNALNVKNIPLLRCLLATSDVMKAFEDVSRPLRAGMEENIKSAHTLATLRDTLLPRLISGQLRLPEAQAAAEEALA